MRRFALAVALLGSLTMTSCVSGPHQLQRTVDDWDRDVYVKQPWINAVLHIIPVIPFARFGASIGDFFITDAYAFWIRDAFAGDGGTGFDHADVPAKRTMGSLLGDGKFLDISGD